VRVHLRADPAVLAAGPGASGRGARELLADLESAGVARAEVGEPGPVVCLTTSDLPIAASRLAPEALQPRPSLPDPWEPLVRAVELGARLSRSKAGGIEVGMAFVPVRPTARPGG
jgi:hypothetical protein